MRFHYHIGSLAILHKSSANPAFVYVLYDECSEDMRGELTSAKYTTRN